jgi:hypothetical protein
MDAYRLCIQCLGSKGKKIGLDRLLTPYKEGGFGLINLQDMNVRMLRSWIWYLRSNIDCAFTALVGKWCTMFTQRYSQEAGPLCNRTAVRGISDPWSFLDEAWNNVHLQNDYSLRNDISILRESDTIFIDDRQYSLVDGYKQPLIRHAIKVSLRITPSQYKFLNGTQRDPVENFKVLANTIQSCKVPDLVKFWNYDLIHIAIATRYKSDVCTLCNNSIGSVHFYNECGAIGWFFKAIGTDNEWKVVERTLVARFLSWRMNLFKMHNSDIRSWNTLLRRVEHQITPTHNPINLKVLNTIDPSSFSI